MSINRPTTYFDHLLPARLTMPDHVAADQVWLSNHVWSGQAQAVFTDLSHDVKFYYSRPQSLQLNTLGHLSVLLLIIRGAQRQACTNTSSSSFSSGFLRKMGRGQIRNLAVLPYFFK
eukprot:scpid99618/ scgid8173/ 